MAPRLSRPVFHTASDKKLGDERLGTRLSLPCRSWLSVQGCRQVGAWGCWSTPKFLSTCCNNVPATNAVSERSLSALRCLKTWLRSTMNQSRLNWCMILHIHWWDSKLDLTAIGNGFINRNPSCRNISENLCDLCVWSLIVEHVIMH